MTNILQFFSSLRLADFLDIAVVTALFFGLLLVLRETRSTAAMRGVLGAIVGCFLVYTLARWLGLTATAMLFERFWIVIFLALLIIFQNEFRKALMDVGQLRAFRRFFTGGGALAIDEVLKAVRTFSRQKVGTLLCIERRDSLKVYAETGTEIDAVITSELLRTIFMTYSPLHDGAVVLRGDRIIAAGCILPLSSNPTLSKELGTRHRAGLGLTDETDAAVIIVSEETGIISLAVGGKLERHHTQESLREALQELMDVEEDAKD
ncbi:MAG: diadenylate cyclase CdaA [Candidatus Sumerlaeaceae bacterium]